MSRKLLSGVTLLTLLTVTTLAFSAQGPQTGNPAPDKGDSTKPEHKSGKSDKSDKNKAPAGKELTRAEIDAFLAHPKKIFILDVRREDEIIKIGTLPGYVNIPLDQLETRWNEIPKGKTVLPVSNHAVRALKAKAILEKHGYKVPGGIGVQNYEKQGGKLILPAPKPQAINWSKKGFTKTQRTYWFYQPIKPTAIPVVKNRKWVRTPVDAYILAQLEHEGLVPSPEADKKTLIRRVTLDVTGLLPTPEAVEAFVADTSPNAYEKVVDRLLSSPAFGEHWARKWLDVARYGDTDGYIQDDRRPNSWRYRDWVINAINSDKPYDRFVKEQIAGDELYPDDPKAIVGTGFLRGYQDEFNARNIGLRRQEILNDITDTTAGAFLGVTLNCARCHDHKFDAIRQKDYFQFQSFFANAVPRDNFPVIRGAELTAWATKKAAWMAATQNITAQIEELVAPGRQKAFEERLPGFVPADRVAITKPETQRTPLEKWIHTRYQWRETGFDRAAVARLAAVDIGDTAIVDPNATQADKDKLKADRLKYKQLTEELKKYAALDPGPMPSAAVLTEETPVAPPTHILFGGAYGNDGEEVQPGFLGVLNPPAPKIVPNARLESTGRRSALANWLVSPTNPLTPRVAVNRLWAGHFGRGIVGTPSDFGVMGDRPTHPQLLDYLAYELVHNGWSQKRLHREILLSSAYRQSSNPSPKTRAADPRNLLFSRYDRQRLEAEELRDSALAAAGLLQTDKIGGPAFQPPLPKGFEQGGGRARNVQSTDPKEYNRRSVYIAVKRNQPDPTLEVFDTPPSFDACPRRYVSTTAPQALTLFNSEQVLSWSQSLAGRVVKEAGEETDKRIDRVYQILYARHADSGEKIRAVNFLSYQTEIVQKRLKTGEKVALPTGLSESADKASGAALVDLCHALLNSNEFIYRL